MSRRVIYASLKTTLPKMLLSIALASSSLCGTCVSSAAGVGAPTHGAAPAGVTAAGFGDADGDAEAGAAARVPGEGTEGEAGFETEGALGAVGAGTWTGAEASGVDAGAGAGIAGAIPCRRSSGGKSSPVRSAMVASS